MSKATKAGPSLAELSARAFGKDVGEKGIFVNPRFEELQAILKLSAEQHALTYLIGKAGIGKTTVVRAFTSQLPSNKYQVLYFGQDQDGNSLLKRFAQALGVKAKFRRSELAMQLSQAISDNAREGGKELLAVIDEAHLFDDRTLEDLRLLTNNDFDTSSPITIILLGQQQLRLRLKDPCFEALNQRLRYRCSLEGFSLEDTAAYIRHRLLSAGGSAEIFSDAAIARIFDSSEGVPREVNNLCALGLLKAHMNGLDAVEEKLMKQVIVQRELS